MGATVQNDKGFSLIELMISMVFIMIAMLAMLSSILTVTNANLENDLRNTAIRLTNQTAETVLALSFTDTDLSDASHSRTAGDANQDSKGFPPVTQTVRNHRQTYTIQWSVESQSADVKEVTITVGYSYRNKNHSNSGVIYKNKSL
jgi:Tfp pilus assembly protein PilV